MMITNYRDRQDHVLDLIREELKNIRNSYKSEKNQMQINQSFEIQKQLDREKKEDF